MPYANPYSAPQALLNKLPVASESYPVELRHVAQGFGFQAAVVRTALLSILGIGGLIFMGSLRIIELTPLLVNTLAGISALALFVLQLLAFLCFSKSPIETGARGTANIGLVTFLLGTGTNLLIMALTILRLLQSPAPLVVLLGLSLICSLISAMALLVYFRQIARYMQDDFATYITSALVNSATVMYLALGLVVLVTVFAGSNPLFQRGGREIALPLAIISAISTLVAGLASLYVTVVYLVTIGGMKRLLQSKLRQS